MFGENFRTKTRQPRAEAIILSADLEELKATFYLVSLQVSESINVQQDQVVMNLAPRASITRMEGQPEYEAPDIDDIYDWADLIEPNDVILVKLYDAALNWNDDNRHLQNFGLYLVDRVSVRMAFGAEGKVTRMILVQGRGFGKLLTEHTLARFPSLHGGASIATQSDDDAEGEDQLEKADAESKDAIPFVREMGLVPSVYGDLTTVLFLAGKDGSLSGPLDTILRKFLRTGSETGEELKHYRGMVILFGNAFMKLRYSYVKSEDGKPQHVYLELQDLLDLTSNIHIRKGRSIGKADVSELLGQEMGPILSVLRAIAAPPFYEIFMRAVPTQEDLGLGVKVHLCIRSCPFDSATTGEEKYAPFSKEKYDESGQWVYQPLWYVDENGTPKENDGTGPAITTIEAWEILNFDIGRADTDTYTFFTASSSHNIIDWGPVKESLIPGFFPGRYPDFSGGTVRDELVNAETSAWVEAHRQIRDRNGPDGKPGGTALLRELKEPTIEAIKSEITGHFDPEKEVGMTHRFGVKAMQIQNKFVPDEFNEKGDALPAELAIKALFAQTALLADWFCMNPHYLSGKIAIAGRADIAKGCWVEVEMSASGLARQALTVGEKKHIRRVRYYVEQVEQQWQFGGNWITQLTVTRGEYIID